MLGVRSKELVQHRLYKERLQNFREDDTGGRERERYDDERVDLCGWMVIS